MSCNNFSTFLSRMIIDFDHGPAAQEWKKERFSLLGEECGYPHADLDIIFFWKVFDQWYLARRSQKVFEHLAKSVNGGPSMIQALSEVPEEWVKSGLKLKQAFEADKLPTKVYNAFLLGKGGWTVLGYSIRTAKKLVSLFGDDAIDSYVQLWLTKFLLQSNLLSRTSLVNMINDQFSEYVTENFTDIFRKLEEKIINPLLRKHAWLPGAGPNTLQYFFRDWCDLLLWPYMFKLDYKNQRFWTAVLEEFGIVKISGELDKHHIIDALSQNLTSKQIKDGALAKLNTFAYRKISTMGSGENRINNADIKEYIHRLL